MRRANNGGDLRTKNGGDYDEGSDGSEADIPLTARQYEAIYHKILVTCSCPMNKKEHT